MFNFPPPQITYGKLEERRVYGGLPLHFQCTPISLGVRWKDEGIFCPTSHLISTTRQTKNFKGHVNLHKWVSERGEKRRRSQFPSPTNLKCMAWFLVKLQLSSQPPDRTYSSPTSTLTHRPTPFTASTSKFHLIFVGH